LIKNELKIANQFRKLNLISNKRKVVPLNSEVFDNSSEMSNYNNIVESESKVNGLTKMQKPFVLVKRKKKKFKFAKNPQPGLKRENLLPDVRLSYFFILLYLFSILWFKRHLKIQNYLKEMFIEKT
jgi:hypothetical protein